MRIIQLLCAMAFKFLVNMPHKSACFFPWFNWNPRGLKSPRIHTNPGRPMKAAPVFHRATTWKQAEMCGRSIEEERGLKSIQLWMTCMKLNIYFFATWQLWMFKFHASRVWILGNLFVQSLWCSHVFFPRLFGKNNHLWSGVVDGKLLEKKQNRGNTNFGEFHPPRLGPKPHFFLNEGLPCVCPTKHSFDEWPVLAGGVKKMETSRKDTTLVHTAFGVTVQVQVQGLVGCTVYQWTELDGFHREVE